MSRNTRKGWRPSCSNFEVRESDRKLRARYRRSPRWSKPGMGALELYPAPGRRATVRGRRRLLRQSALLIKAKSCHWKHSGPRRTSSIRGRSSSGNSNNHACSSIIAKFRSQSGTNNCDDGTGGGFTIVLGTLLALLLCWQLAHADQSSSGARDADGRGGGGGARGGGSGGGGGPGDPRLSPARTSTLSLLGRIESASTMERARGPGSIARRPARAVPSLERPRLRMAVGRARTRCSLALAPEPARLNHSIATRPVAIVSTERRRRADWPRLASDERGCLVARTAVAFALRQTLRKCRAINNVHQRRNSNSDSNSNERTATIKPKKRGRRARKQTSFAAAEEAQALHRAAHFFDDNDQAQLVELLAEFYAHSRGLQDKLEFIWRQLQQQQQSITRSNIVIAHNQQELKNRIMSQLGADVAGLSEWLREHRDRFDLLKNRTIVVVTERPNRTIIVCDDGPKTLVLWPNASEVYHCFSREQWIAKLWSELHFSAIHYPFLVLNVLIFLFGTIGNMFVCLSVKRNHQLRNVTNYFIVNLAFADFLVILICLPATVVWDLSLTWFFDTIPCKLIMFLQDVSISVSVLTLTAISIDRYYAICHPLRFKSNLNQAKRIIALIWLVSLLIMAPDLVYLNAKRSADLSSAGIDTVLYSDCNYDWSEEASMAFQFVKTILLYLIPFVVMFCTHFRTLCELHKAAEAISSSTSSYAAARLERSQSDVELASTKELASVGPGYLSGKSSRGNNLETNSLSPGTPRPRTAELFRVRPKHKWRNSPNANERPATNGLTPERETHSSISGCLNEARESTPATTEQCDISAAGRQPRAPHRVRFEPAAGEAASLAQPNHRKRAMQMKIKCSNGRRRFVRQLLRAARRVLESQTELATDGSSKVEAPEVEANRGSSPETAANFSSAHDEIGDQFSPTPRRPIIKFSSDGHDGDAVGGAGGSGPVKEVELTGIGTGEITIATQSSPPVDYVQVTSSSLASTLPSSIESDTLILIRHNQSKLESRRKAANMLITIVVLFAICYLPVHLINFLRQFIHDIPQTDVISTFSMLAHCFCYLNSAINPIIYNHMNSVFRAEFRKFLRSCFFDCCSSKNTKRNNETQLKEQIKFRQKLQHQQQLKHQQPRRSSFGFR